MKRNTQFHILAIAAGLVTWPIMMFLDLYPRHYDNDELVSFALGIGVFLVLEFVNWFINKTKERSTKTFHLLTILSGFSTFLLSFGIEDGYQYRSYDYISPLFVGIGVIIVLELVYWFISGSLKKNK